jgi:5'-phosphate synthase pdxT subunit
LSARIGVLGLQGDVREHARVLAENGYEPRLVLGPTDLDGIEGLVLPGGESTTQAMLLESSGLRAPLAKLLGEGMPVLGTCAGLILLAREIQGGRPDQWSFGTIDVTVARNGFGRQVRSFETDLEVKGIDDGAVHAVFIRAPLPVRVGPGVEVLGEVEYPRGSEGSVRVPVVVRQGTAVGVAFHPELEGDGRLHRLAFVGQRGASE